MKNPDNKVPLEEQQTDLLVSIRDYLHDMNDMLNEVSTNLWAIRNAIEEKK